MGTGCGSGWAGQGRAMGENWDNCNRTTIGKKKKSLFGAESHRFREQTDGCQMGEGSRWVGEKGDEINKYKLVITK